MFSIELAFDRPTKRTVRYQNEEFGTVYIPNQMVEDLGRPDAIRLTIEPLGAPQELAQAA
jgi:hypothetical protein